MAPPITLALLGASDNVIDVSAAFGMCNGKLNLANLPLLLCLFTIGFSPPHRSIKLTMRWIEAKLIQTTGVISFFGTVFSVTTVAIPK
ncbi:MAG: hypothetical protein ACJA2Q_001328 [Pseudohongiellaceae bacterium]